MQKCYKKFFSITFYEKYRILCGLTVLIFPFRSTQPLSNDVLSSISLLLELLRVLLSCEVIGRVDTHTPTSQKDPKLPPVHHFESRTLSVPKSFVKALVTKKDGTDLLVHLVQVSIAIMVT